MLIPNPRKATAVLPLTRISYIPAKKKVLAKIVIKILIYLLTLSLYYCIIHLIQ